MCVVVVALCADVVCVAVGVVLLLFVLLLCCVVVVALRCCCVCCLSAFGLFVCMCPFSCWSWSCVWFLLGCMNVL